MIKGLVLAEKYFEAYGTDILRLIEAKDLQHISIGRIGEGSECYGYDDCISQDHDYGPGFCIWVDDCIWNQYKSRLTQAYRDLPEKFMGYNKPGSEQFAERVGAMSTSMFYQRFMGPFSRLDKDSDWFSIPQEVLSVCSNGKLFFGKDTDFIRMRNRILSYYPENIRLKKIAGHCAVASQSGQYNLNRCLKRNEHAASERCLSDFIYHYTAIVFLLNKKYMPPYKWANKALGELVILSDTAAEINKLSIESKTIHDDIEKLCSKLSDTLFAQSYSQTKNSYLLNQAKQIQSSISSSTVEELPLMSWINGWQR